MTAELAGFSPLVTLFFLYCQSLQHTTKFIQLKQCLRLAPNQAGMALTVAPAGRARMMGGGVRLSFLACCPEPA